MWYLWKHSRLWNGTTEWTNGCVSSCTNSPEDGPVGPKHVEIQQYTNKIVTSVSFHFIYRSHFKSPWRWRRRIVTKGRKQTSTLTARPLKIGLTSCSETSVTNYPPSLGKIAVERRSKMHTQFWWGYFRERASWKRYGSNKPILCILPCIWECKMKYLVYGTYVIG